MYAQTNEMYQPGNDILGGKLPPGTKVVTYSDSFPGIDGLIASRTMAGARWPGAIIERIGTIPKRWPMTFPVAGGDVSDRIYGASTHDGAFAGPYRPMTPDELRDLGLLIPGEEPSLQDRSTITDLVRGQKMYFGDGEDSFGMKVLKTAAEIIFSEIVKRANGG